MANVAKMLKEEISRISKKQAKSAVDPIGKTQTTLRKAVADLRKRLISLERENKRLVAAVGKEKTAGFKETTEDDKRARITSKGVRSLRSRLGISQADLAKLLGATPHSVYLWEKRGGALRLRDKTKEAFLSIRGLGAKQAKDKLAETERKKRSAGRKSSKKK